MSESVSINGEKCKFDGTNANDVVPLQCTAMATDDTHNDYKTLICSSGAGSVSSLSLNDTIRTTLTVRAEAAVTHNSSDSTEEDKMIPNVVNANVTKFNSIHVQNNNGNPMKTKRRRRKSSKQKTNSKPYKKSNWNYQNRVRNGSSRLVPYNTNEFLMEEHMPEISEGGRCRDSSFSFDSDNDKEEYLSKEFCNVYENARSDRLYEMTKSQLIQEYLQLEASYDKLSNNLGKISSQLDTHNGITSNNILKRLADRVQELTVENLELRRQMADIRSRDSRHHNGSHNKANRHMNCNAKDKSATSEDSESDSSSSSSSSSRSSLSNSSSTSHSSAQSKSSQMSGISNADECSQLIKNDFNSVNENEVAVTIDQNT